MDEWATVLDFAADAVTVVGAGLRWLGVEEGSAVVVKEVKVQR